jgi:hypothetical protein
MSAAALLVMSLGHPASLPRGQANSTRSSLARHEARACATFTVVVEEERRSRPSRSISATVDRVDACAESRCFALDVGLRWLNSRRAR